MDGDQVLPDVHHFFTEFTVRSVHFTLAAFFFKTLNSLLQLLFKVSGKNQGGNRAMFCHSMVL